MRLRRVGQGRVLDFDVETLAAGFADPEWVPQKITVASWSWVGSDHVESVVTGKDGFFDARRRGRRLRPLLAAIAEADMVTGHNLLRFDLPVLVAECVRCGLPVPSRVLVQDTMRIVRAKGLKKGQDVLSVTLGGRLEKKTMNWAEWERAYEENRWPEIVERCESDIRQHKEIRERLIERDLLKPPQVWRP